MWTPSISLMKRWLVGGKPSAAVRLRTLTLLAGLWCWALVLDKIDGKCYSIMVSIQIVVARLLSVLAMIGFLIAPIASPPVWAANAFLMAEMADMAGPMECCPQHKAAVPDCQKHCPSAAFCVGKCFSDAVPVAGHSMTFSWVMATLVPGDIRHPDRLSEPPPSRPPRT